MTRHGLCALVRMLCRYDVGAKAAGQAQDSELIERLGSAKAAAEAKQAEAKAAGTALLKDGKVREFMVVCPALLPAGCNRALVKRD